MPIHYQLFISAYGFLHRDVFIQNSRNLLIGSIYCRILQRSQIDQGRSFRSVPHPRADNGKGDVVFSCSRGPAVPGYIGRERLLQVQALCQFLQLLIVAIQCCLILGKSLVGFRCPQNREKVRRISRRRMPDDNFAHARFDADA